MSNILKGLYEGYEDHHLFPDWMQKVLKKHEQSPEEKAMWAKKATDATQSALDADKANIESLKQELEQAKKGFDPNFEYSDDHAYWSEQQSKKNKIQNLIKRIKAASSTQLDELSPETLASYKKKAGAQASALDKAAWAGQQPTQQRIEKAHQRYKGITAATKRELGIKEANAEQSAIDNPNYHDKTWSFSEIADKLGIPVKLLNLLAFHEIGNFPEARPGLSSKYGSTKYYSQKEIKNWVNSSGVKDYVRAYRAKKQGMTKDQLDEISADPAYLRAAERSKSQAQATQRTFGKSPEEKAAARRTELKREKGIAGYSKRHKAAHPEMYPKVTPRPAPKLRDPSTEYSDDYSTWAKGRRDTMEQDVAEGKVKDALIKGTYGKTDIETKPRSGGMFSGIMNARNAIEKSKQSQKPNYNKVCDMCNRSGDTCTCEEVVPVATKHPAEDHVARELKTHYGDAMYKSAATGSTHKITSYAPNEFRCGMMKSRTLSGLLNLIDKKVNNKASGAGTMSFREGVAEGQTPEKEIERLKLRQNAEHGGASLKRQAATQARIRELEKQIKDKKGVAEASHQYHVVSKLDGNVLASYKTKEEAHKNAHGNPVVSGSLETIGDRQYVREQGVAEAEGEAKQVDMKRWMRDYDRREDKNFHTENVLAIAELVGDANDIATMMKLVKAHKAMGLTDDQFAIRQAIYKKLWPLVVEKLQAQGIAEDSTETMLEETYHGNEFYEAYGDLWYDEEQLNEAEYQGRKVALGKPMRGDVKKFKVYVKDPKTGNIKKVNFGDPNMRIKKSNPARRKSFRARHHCENPGPRTSARYWSCRKW